jgi:hypothetical protein
MALLGYLSIHNYERIQMTGKMPTKITLAIAALFIAVIPVLYSNRAIFALLVVSTMIAGICSREKEESLDEPIESYVPEVEESDADLRELPVETIEGIGTTHGRELRNAGIETLKELMRARADEVADISDVNIETAQRWIAMSRFCWMETVSEEDAEAIVYAGGIIDVKELASADSDSLFRKIDTSIKKGHVRIPEGYEIPREKVSIWIHEAKSLLE